MWLQLNAVELGPPPDRPADGLLHPSASGSGEDGVAEVGAARTGAGTEYYWEKDTRLSPVLALVKPARVTLLRARS